MKDLHVAKESHLSTPITKNVEIHFNNKDLGKTKLKVGKKYTVKMPVMATSADKHHSRVKQSGKMSVDVETNLKNSVKRMFGTRTKAKGEVK